MKQLTLNSERYPGLALPVPQVPGTPPGTRGSFTFSVGIPHEVTDETATAIADLLAGLEPRVSRHYQLTVLDLSTDAAIAAPSEVIPFVDEPAALVFSDDDNELIEFEVAKLKGLTIAQATPLIENTALNDELPVELRRAYLQAVIETKNVKALDKLATDLLETLAD